MTHTYQELTNILKNLDRELVRGALSGEQFENFFYANCQDSKIENCVREIMK